MKTFEKTRKQGIKIIKEATKRELNPTDIHDAVWVLWRDYYEETHKED